MSFQAYLDTAEQKTGKTPQQILDLLHQHGFSTESKAAPVMAFLHDELDLGRGHAMPLFHVLTKGARISDKHVGTTGTHRDDSDLLRLDGIARR